MEYGVSLWLPWISNSTLENQERSQRYVVRAIIGQLRTTPVKAIIAEANLPSIRTLAIQLSTIAMDKSVRTTLINPLHTTATQRERQRTKKPSLSDKQVMSCEKSSAIPTSPQYSHLSHHRLTPMLTSLS